MTKPVTLPNTFGTQGGTIPLNYLDQDFTVVTNSLNDLATYSNYALDSGSINNFVANYSSGIITSSLTSGLRLQFKASNTNTGASTLQVQVNTVSIGTAAIRLTDGSALSAGQIVSGAIVDVVYDGTNFQLLNDPGGGSSVVTDLTVTGNLAVTGTSTFTGNVTANIANVTTFTSNPTFSGNVTLQGNGSNIQGNLTTGNVTFLGSSNFIGNVTANIANVTTFSGNPTFTGNVTITSNGSNVQGNLTVGNVSALGNCTFNSNVNIRSTFFNVSNTTVVYDTTGSKAGGNVAYGWNGILIGGIPRNTTSGGTVSTSASLLLTTTLLSASAATTITDAAQILIASAPSAFTNVTITNRWGLRTTGTAKSSFEANVSVNGSTLRLLNGNANELAAQTAFSTVGMGLRIDAGTYFDLFTPPGTITINAANSIASPTFAGGNGAITITTAASLYLEPPLAGANVTITNAYSLYLAEGSSYFGGNLTYVTANYADNTASAVVGMNIYTPVKTYTGLGAATTQTYNSPIVIQTPTFAFANATTITHGASIFVAGGATAGANATITNAWGIYSLGDIGSAGSILGATSTGRIGYDTGTGAGGAITQATSRTTGVTLNTPTGAITLFTAAGTTAATTFTVTNSSVAITDVIILSQRSGTNLYNLEVTAVAAGSFNITFFTTGGVASDAPVFNYAVIKGAAT
jgi:hypothetical protein